MTSRKPSSRSRSLAPRGNSGLAKAQGSLRPGSKVAILSEVPAEDVWLANLRSVNARRAYKRDVRDFLEALDIRTRDELYAIKPAHVIEWRAQLEQSHKPTSVRRKLSALSSLFKHLVEEHLVEVNPVLQVTRPRDPVKKGDRNQKRGKTPALLPDQARAVLDAPPLLAPGELEDGTQGDIPLAGDKLVQHLRDRAILSLGFQAGLRRSEIASLRVRDIFYKEKLPHVRYMGKGGYENEVPLNPQTYARINAYLDAAQHGGEDESPLFHPMRGNQHVAEEETERHLEPDMVDKILRKWAVLALGEKHAKNVGAHTMRATFITRALENGCRLERVQQDVGHAHISTTQLYDRRGDNPEEAATFFANY